MLEHVKRYYEPHPHGHDSTVVLPVVDVTVVTVVRGTQGNEGVSLEYGGGVRVKPSLPSWYSEMRECLEFCPTLLMYSVYA